jgi:hypothetical protein
MIYLNSFLYAAILKTYWKNNTCWSFLPTFYTALEYLFPLAAFFSKAELRFPILFYEPPVFL